MEPKPISITLDREEWKVIADALRAASYKLGDIFADRGVMAMTAKIAEAHARQVGDLSNIIYSKAYDK